MNILQLFKPVTTFIFDIDGVLTDGSLLVFPEGLMVRRMNIKDGYALQLAVKKGYGVIIISGSHSSEVQSRLNKLGIQHVFMNVHTKENFLFSYISEMGLDINSLLYMGDDIPDLAAMRMVQLPCCPADAVEEIKEVSKYISGANGGEGCVRDVIEKVLKLNNHWDTGAHISAL